MKRSLESDDDENERVWKSSNVDQLCGALPKRIMIRF
jgi:hypothetical protein